MQKVLSAQRVLGTKREKRDLAESVLLRICANWESFIDEHLADCVNCDHSRLSEFFAVKIPSNPSKDLCQALLFGNGFRDFKSAGDLLAFSKKVLPSESNPFVSISTEHRAKIDEAYTIRNYLAHYSSAGTRSLKKLYTSKYRLRRFIEPGQFLMSGNGKRLWAYFDAFQGASDQLKAWCERG
jgi:hypothetical protein